MLLDDVFFIYSWLAMPDNFPVRPTEGCEVCFERFQSFLEKTQVRYIKIGFI